MAESSERAKYGAAALAGLRGQLPNPFPRLMGPNCGKYLQEVVDSGLTADLTGRFERAFARKMGVGHCIATPGCTAALAVLAAALPFAAGDEIIASSVTDYGTIQGLIREHYVPVFADTEPGSLAISARSIEPLISERTRAILCVHMTGTICDMDPINELARRHGLFVYEDVCQAVFGEYRGRLAGTLGQAAGFSFDSEKTMGSDVGGCIVTNDDQLAERMRFVGQSRGGEMRPGYGRIHSAPGYAYRMPLCTGAVTLAQLEMARPQVAQRDRMIRLLYRLLAEIPGITPLPIPDYMNVYSCWMAGFSIDPAQFRCSAGEFAQQLEAAGVPGAGLGQYYLMPEAVTFLEEHARAEIYPYSLPPASRRYHYGADCCPQARDFLRTFIRWSTFCEKYQPEHCQLAADLVRQVGDANRR